MIKVFFSKQFLKYLIIGFMGTGLDFLILYSLTEYAHFYYVLSAIVSVAIVFWLSFIANKFWTFENKKGKYFVQFVKYLFSRTAGYAINLIILILLVEIFGLWYLFAKVFATAAAAIWNFLTARKWVFPEEKL